MVGSQLLCLVPAAVTALATLPLQKSSRTKVRNIMSAIFTHARRWELTDRNPITLVRQSAKRSKTSHVLTTTEVTALLKELPEPALTAVFVAIATGLRVSELLALRWSDVDFDAQTITPRRGIVHQHIGGLKTEESGKSVPASEVVTDALKAWRGISLYSNQKDFIFPSPTMGGQQPFWPCPSTENHSTRCNQGEDHQAHRLAHSTPNASDVARRTGNVSQADSGNAATCKQSHHVRTLRAIEHGSKAGSTAGAAEGYGRHVGTRTPDLYRVKVAL